MSHFYGSIPSSSRATVPTACATRHTGLTVTAASWAGAITTRLWVDSAGIDRFDVIMAPHQGTGDHLTIATGVVGDSSRVGFGHHWPDV